MAGPETDHDAFADSNHFYSGTGVAVSDRCLAPWWDLAIADGTN